MIALRHRGNWMLPDCRNKFVSEPNGFTLRIAGANYTKMAARRLWLARYSERREWWSCSWSGRIEGVDLLLCNRQACVRSGAWKEPCLKATHLPKTMHWVCRLILMMGAPPKLNTTDRTAESTVTAFGTPLDWQPIYLATVWASGVHLFRWWSPLSWLCAWFQKSLTF